MGGDWRQTRNQSLEDYLKGIQATCEDLGVEVDNQLLGQLAIAKSLMCIRNELSDFDHQICLGLKDAMQHESLKVSADVSTSD